MIIVPLLPQDEDPDGNIQEVNGTEDVLGNLKGVLGISLPWQIADAETVLSLGVRKFCCQNDEEQVHNDHDA